MLPKGIIILCCILVLSRSAVSDSVTLRTEACQAPLCMGFPRQEYYSGLPFPFPGDLPNPGTEAESPASAGGFFTTESPGKPRAVCYWCNKYSLILYCAINKYTTIMTIHKGSPGTVFM